MARNVEIKARVTDPAALRARALALADGAPVEIAQDDTFFACPNGRLKLRAFGLGEGQVPVGGPAELIFYRRTDQTGPKTSFYRRTPTADPDGLREALTLAWGATGRVRKRRTLLMAGRTRIHLDRVEGLGDFVELEVVLAEGEAAEVGEREALALMARLGIEAAVLVETAYVDLLAAAATPSHRLDLVDAEVSRLTLAGGTLHLRLAAVPAWPLLNGQPQWREPGHARSVGLSLDEAVAQGDLGDAFGRLSMARLHLSGAWHGRLDLPCTHRGPVRAEWRFGNGAQVEVQAAGLRCDWLGTPSFGESLAC